MKIALVHDDLVQWGGAERVLLGISQIFPKAPIFTSLFDRTNQALVNNFSNKKIITSFMQLIPGWRKLYKLLLPFYGIAFEQFDFSKYDLVISHTTRFAKSIITKPETKHICYCHTPPRFLWRFSGEKNYGKLELLLTKLRMYDAVSARRVDHFIAGSKNAQKRIKKVYKEDSKVVYPFIDLKRFANIESFNGEYYLIISRGSKYKRIDLVVEVCQKLKLPLRVIGGFRGVQGIQGVEFLGNLDDETVVQVLAGCKALIIAGIEDFGLTSLEAQALGKPVVAFGQGGVLETIIPNKTGILFDSQQIESLASALQKLESVKINPEDCKANAVKFSQDNFTKHFKQTITDLLYTN